MDKTPKTMPGDSSETERLLSRLGAGEPDALGPLLDRPRARLLRLARARLDRRLVARVDPSDIVQEALADASSKLLDYLRERPIPFVPWLRGLVLDRLCAARRRHVEAGKRSVVRESRPVGARGGSGSTRLDHPAAQAATPSRIALAAEESELFRAALGRLAVADRQILELRYFDQLAFSDIAARLDLGLSAVKMRHLRAVERLQAVVDRS